MVIKVQTEEVCDACGSTNIGYDALVKRIDGALEIVGGPYDACECINEYCQSLETRVRNVPVQSLRYCNGKDCDYQGDKDVMTNKPIENSTLPSGISPYKCWYCSHCAKESN